MKTTLDLPDPLMREVRIRAAQDGRKLKDLVAELLRCGLDASSSPESVEKAVIEMDPKSGFPVIRSRKTPGFTPPTLEEGLALIQQVNEEEDLHCAGILD